MSRREEVGQMLDVALASPRPGGAGSELPDAPPVDPVRIGSVTLAVRDMHAVANFYRDVIGLEDLHVSPDRVSLGAGGTTLLNLLHRPDGRPDDPATAGLFHTAFLLPGRGDLGGWLRHIGQRGHALDGAADHLVSEAFYLHDPEGNGVEVYSDRPRREWRWEGGAVVMANDNPDMRAILAGAHDWGGAPPGTHVGHVHLRVGDARRAAAFYTVEAGLDVTRAWPSAVFMSSGGYHHHIACNEWSSHGAGVRDPDRSGLVSVEVEGLERTIRDPWGNVLVPAA